uniref:Yippee domain-containing protein n=1 Tax=Grammatophora oceanica TaxID=210454 RepID=A0A7S1V3L9_9STRA|mmetsp:Transcript_35523/g.52889  ORF Transcript_35523/g.52889 Transcript_35523/m.52889 type:complete len:337 (+) Transcript_35523:303-1313(+)|eukprot:CAMPEP_0194048954 /NCGR_PEP_ID=MMETSP0009_2-20130614/29110_1 /TAXON_ID=210454 /ORGANISM="Grammatophora oceanica, Strain CCMP 410" /LENGTH=336 /DNA_ID=CAMNT_0038694989 /DNA_START=262 /DNA_END=1272 /DNA_ORIENTATION=-
MASDQHRLPRRSLAATSSSQSGTSHSSNIRAPSPNTMSARSSSGTPSLQSSSPSSFSLGGGSSPPFLPMDARLRGTENAMSMIYLPDSPAVSKTCASPHGTPRSTSSKKSMSGASIAIAKAKARTAQQVNDAMVYLDGPQVYTCGQCRTHLTSHDDIISKSFHGRHGRAYLFDQCVNVIIGPSEDRQLITGLHSVCDIFCKRCKGMIGWTYTKAYDQSQRYKEGKFIIEKIHLHMEESDYYDVTHPAGERSDRWRLRSMSWGSERSMGSGRMSPNNPSFRSSSGDIVYEYQPGVPHSPRYWESPASSRATQKPSPALLRPPHGGGAPSGPPSAPTL